MPMEIMLDVLLIIILVQQLFLFTMRMVIRPDTLLAQQVLPVL